MATTETTAPREGTDAPKPQVALAVPDDGVIGFTSASGFALLQRGATLLAASTLVPDAFRGNVPNCVIALNMANRMNADPLMVMQNLYIVYGRPGWSAVFLIATFNQSGKFTALRYKWEGERGKDTWGCRATAVEKATGESLEGALVNIQLAKDEGWYDRKDKNGNYVSKWRTMPEQMLMYRSASFFIKTHAPELAMGLPVTEEVEDQVIDVTPEPPRGPTVVTPDSLLGGVRTADVVAGATTGEEFGDGPGDGAALSPSQQVAAAVKAAASTDDPAQPALPMGRSRKA